MANRERGEVTFQVESETYTLRLDLNALCEVEAALSTPELTVTWAQALQMAQRNSLSAMRAILWAALRPNHPRLTLQDAGVLIERMGGIPGMAKTFKAAVEAGLPKTPPKGKRPRKARRTGTGASSSSEPGVSGSTVRRFGT